MEICLVLALIVPLTGEEGANRMFGCRRLRKIFCQFSVMAWAASASSHAEPMGNWRDNGECRQRLSPQAVQRRSSGGDRRSGGRANARPRLRESLGLAAEPQRRQREVRSMRLEHSTPSSSSVLYFSRLPHL